MRRSPVGEVGRPRPGVVAATSDAQGQARLTHVQSLPGQSRNHRVEPFGQTPARRKTSFTFRATASSVPSLWMRFFIGSEFDLLVGAQAVDLSVINLVLPDPVVDRRLAHAKSLLELPCAECLTELTRSPDDEPPWGTCRAFDPPSRRRIPKTRVNFFGGRSYCPSCDIHIVRMELLVRLATRLSSP